MSYRDPDGRPTSYADRDPYVGAGADGARRSAQIDREEAETLDRDDPRRETVLESARRWDEEAERLERGAIIPPPTHAQIARELLEANDRLTGGARPYAHAQIYALVSIAESLEAIATVLETKAIYVTSAEKL